MNARRRRSRRSLALGLLVALTWPASLCAEDRAPPGVPPPPPPLLDADGIGVGVDGVARVIVQPEFLAAGALREQLLALGVPGLGVHLVAPRVALPAPSPRAKLPPPVLSRLLLHGPLEKVRDALSTLRRLDRPVRAVRVCMTVAEIWGEKYTERGGSFLFDRGAATEPKNTIFRALQIGFEPNEYVRSQRLGLRPYEGQSTHLFKDGLADGLFDATIRGMYRRGHASYVARPNLLLNEGKVGELTAVRQIPQMLTSGRAAAPVVTQRDETVGVRMRIVPLRVSRDAAVLDLDVWFRIPEASKDTGAPAGALVLKERRVRTQVVARDGESLLLSGIRMRRNDKGFLDPIPLLPPIDPVFASAQRFGRTSEVWFLVRIYIREPAVGRDGPTHHARFGALK